MYAQENEPIGDVSDAPPVSSAEHTVRVQQLFIKNQSALKGFLLALVPDFAEAEDLLQEVFLVVTQKAGTFKEGTNFMAWARQIARFKAMSSWRKKKNSPQVLAEDVVESLCACEPEEPFDETQVAAVQNCIKKLAPHARKLVTMRYLNEHRPGEIAERMSWSENAVNVTLSRARTFLRECVQRQMRRRAGGASWCRAAGVRTTRRGRARCSSTKWRGRTSPRCCPASFVSGCR